MGGLSLGQRVSVLAMPYHSDEQWAGMPLPIIKYSSTKTEVALL